MAVAARWLVAKLRTFFAANPDEELDYECLQAKFGCSYGAAVDAVRELRSDGTLEALHVIRVKEKGVAR